jgi:hypothetical protein
MLHVDLVECEREGASMSANFLEFERGCQAILQRIMSDLWHKMTVYIGNTLSTDDIRIPG